MNCHNVTGGKHKWAGGIVCVKCCAVKLPHVRLRPTMEDKYEQSRQIADALHSRLVDMMWERDCARDVANGAQARFDDRTGKDKRKIAEAVELGSDAVEAKDWAQEHEREAWSSCRAARLNAVRVLRRAERLILHRLTVPKGSETDVVLREMRDFIEAHHEGDRE